MTKLKVALLVGALLASTACIDSSATPDLVSATGLSPRSVEAGDTLQISGRGFPEGVPVRLTFHGDLFRAGKAPQKNVEIVVRTQDTSKDTITLAINDEVEQAFCGAGDFSAHATFRGELSVAFAARSGGLAPVTGTLRNVSLEVQPRLGSYQVEREREKVASEALAFLGLTLDDNATSGCCTVADVQGRGLVAGLRQGDRLLDFDGVTVVRASDLVPSGRNRTARLSVSREGTQGPLVRHVDVQGFRWTIPSELAPALACVLTVLGFVLAWVSPLRTLLSAMAGALARRLSENAAGQLSSVLNRNRMTSAVRRYALDAPLPESAAVRVAILGSVIGLGSLCTVMTIREELLSAELDLPLWWLATTMAFALSAFVLSLAHWRLGFVKSLLGALYATVHQLPLLGLIISIAIVTRTSRISDIVRFQKGWPQQWLLFHDPALFVSAILALVALTPEVLPSMTTGSARSATVPNASASAGMMSFVVNRLHLWVECVLLAIIVLGGWAVPGLGHESPPSTALKLLAIGGLLVKVSLLVATVSIVRWALGAVRQQHSIRWTLRWGLPVSVGATAVTIAWNYWVRHFAITWADTVMHFVIMGLFTAATTLLVLQTRSRLRSGSSSMALVSPWI